MRLSPVLAGALALAGGAHAEEVVPARLAGHAVLPALSLELPPEDAPRDALVSGKFTGAARNDAPYSAPADTGASMGARPTGLSLPFIGQAVQGFSGLAFERAPDGSFYVLTDNGFGTKRNSGDALLAFRRIAPDWETGAVDIRETVFLSDPDRVVPFRIVNEATGARYLTGGDFDPESIQIVGDEVWIGDEFGPYLIRATLDGGDRRLRHRGGRRRGEEPGQRQPAGAGRGGQGLALAAFGRVRGHGAEPGYRAALGAVRETAGG